MILPSKLHIALCITELHVGGAERVLVELATRLDRTRFEPFVCSMKPRPVEGEHHFLDVLREADIAIEFADIASPLTLPLKIAKLRKIFKLRKPHVCQSFLFHANFFSRLAARSAGVPVVVSGIRVAEHEKKWHLQLDRLTQSLVNQYICVSKGVAEHTAAQGGIAQRKITVIPNGIDVAGYENASPVDLTSCGCSPNTRKVIVIGRLHQQKGIDWLLQTMPLWLEQRPDCELLIVGDGPERNRLEHMAMQLPSHDRVRFLGHRRDVPQLLAAARLLLLPSRWEGMPNVVMQAMAAGLPIVATEAEGIEELLLEQHHAFEAIEAAALTSPQTCRFGDANEFAAKVNAILDQPELGQRLGEQNREHIRQHFSVERMVEAYEQLWQSLFLMKIP